VAEYVELRGIRTWYDVHGVGEPLLLVHPGGVGVDSRAFGPNVPQLSEAFRVYTPDRRGHGRTPDVDGPITYEAMAADTIEFIERIVGAPTRVLGMSDGAITALYVAMERPDLVTQLAFVAGVFHRDGWHPSALEGDPQEPEIPPFLKASYEKVSPDGGSHAPVIARKLAQMHATAPTFDVADLAKVRTRTLVMVGDDDEVSPEHAVTMYRGLSQAELAIVPGTSHGLLVEKPSLCNTILLDFFSNTPVETYAPIRRRAVAQS
jgi:pimeloyl-ACP methyl ester carboxylesterase